MTRDTAITPADDYTRRMGLRIAFDRVRRVVPARMPDEAWSLPVAEAIYELAGREHSEGAPYSVELRDGRTRHYLVDSSRAVLDLVADQHGEMPDYTNGRPCELPATLSDRARRLVDDVHERWSKFNVQQQH